MQVIVTNCYVATWSWRYFFLSTVVRMIQPINELSFSFVRRMNKIGVWIARS